jgi:hypothetical protein
MRPLFGTNAAGNGTTAAGEMNGAATNGAGQSATALPSSVIGTVSTLAAERPEVMIAAAFAGGLALAMLVRRLGR